jgi:hypothetical protein
LDFEKRRRGREREADMKVLYGLFGPHTHVVPAGKFLENHEGGCYKEEIKVRDGEIHIPLFLAVSAPHNMCASHAHFSVLTTTATFMV